MSRQQRSLIEPLAATNYTDPEVYAAEQEAIFASSWQYVCHVEKLTNPGDYVVCEVAGESLILVRDEDDGINALYNVCVHRAARLLQGEGCKRRISCPYHAWTYGLDGRLLSAPNADNVAGFELNDYALEKCRVSLLQGLVFVNLDNSAAALRDIAPEFAAELQVYAPDLPSLSFVHRTETLLRANWKAAVENYAECYHCEPIHRQLVSSVLDFSSYQIRVFERSHKHLSRAQQGRARAYEFDESVDSEFAAWWLWPNFAFQNYPGGRVHVWQWTPLAVDQTRLTVDWYFPSHDLAAWEQRLIEHHASTTFAEDQDIINSVQVGLSSRAYKPGPLMIDAEQSRYSEHAVAALQQWWREAMGVNHEL